MLTNKPFNAKRERPRRKVAKKMSTNKPFKSKRGRPRKIVAGNLGRHNSAIAVDRDTEYEVIGLNKMWMCKMCNKEFIADIKGLCCESCDLPYCISCVEIDKTDFKVLTKRGDFHWYCPLCEKKVVKNIKTDKQIEDRCREFMAKMELRLVNLEREMKTKRDNNSVKQGRKGEEVARHDHKETSEKSEEEKNEEEEPAPPPEPIRKWNFKKKALRKQYNYNRQGGRFCTANERMNTLTNEAEMMSADQASNTGAFLPVTAATVTPSTTPTVARTTPTPGATATASTDQLSVTSTLLATADKDLIKTMESEQSEEEKNEEEKPAPLPKPKKKVNVKKRAKKKKVPTATLR